MEVGKRIEGKRLRGGPEEFNAETLRARRFRREEPFEAPLEARRKRAEMGFDKHGRE